MATATRTPKPKQDDSPAETPTATTPTPPAEAPTNLLANPPRLVPADADIPEGYVVIPLPPTYPSTIKRIMPVDEYAARIARLSAPFAVDQIEKLPKQKFKTPEGQRPNYFDCKPDSPDARRASADGIYCGGRHDLSFHLDYIGHAGITMRLNEVDPLWFMQPFHVDQGGAPLWNTTGTHVRLHLLGMMHDGFGDAGGKGGPNAVKEVIGDALRNAAMRFGVATYLWSKSEAAAALKTGDHEPESTPAPALTELQFIQEVEAAYNGPNVADALIAVGNKHGRPVLDALMVHTRDGGQDTATRVLEALIADARGANQPAGARTHLDDGARAQDAQPARAQQEPERAPNAREPEQDARPDARTQAERTQELRAQMEHAQQSAPPLTRAQQMQVERLIDELKGQASLSGTTLEQFVAPLLEQAQAPALEQVAPLRLQRFAFGYRAAAIDALRKQGRLSEAASYERAQAGNVIASWSVLTRVDESEQGAMEDAPAGV